MSLLKDLLAKRIKSRRKEVGYKTQSDFAEALGVDQGTVARWESGVHAPSEDYNPMLKRLLKVDDQFFRATEADLNPLAAMQSQIEALSSEVRFLKKEFQKPIDSKSYNEMESRERATLEQENQELRDRLGKIESSPLFSFLETVTDEQAEAVRLYLSGDAIEQARAVLSKKAARTDKT